MWFGIVLVLLGLLIGIPNQLELFGGPTDSAESFFLNALVGLATVGVPGWLGFLLLRRRWIADKDSPLPPLERATRDLAKAKVDATLAKRAAIDADLKAEWRGRKVLGIFDSADEMDAKDRRAEAEEAEYEKLLADQDYRYQLRRKSKRSQLKNRRRNDSRGRHRRQGKGSGRRSSHR